LGSRTYSLRLTSEQYETFLSIFEDLQIDVSNCKSFKDLFLKLVDELKTIPYWRFKEGFLKGMKDEICKRCIHKDNCKYNYNYDECNSFKDFNTCVYRVYKENIGKVYCDNPNKKNVGKDRLVDVDVCDACFRRRQAVRNKKVNTKPKKEPVLPNTKVVYGGFF